MTDDTETVNPASLASIPIQTMRDSRLSLEGLGLLCRLLSRPNNCQVQMGTLRLELGIGQDKLRNLLAAAKARTAGITVPVRDGVHCRRQRSVFVGKRVYHG